MPKAKAADVQRDRFIIHANVPRVQVGDVLAMYTEMGITDVSYEFVTDIRTHHRNPGRDSASLLGEYLNNLGSRKSFSTKEVVNHFVAAGATGSAAYFALKKMVDTNQLTKFEDKTYALAPKQLPAPARAESEAESEAAPENGQRLSKVERAIRFLKGRESFHRSELTKEIGAAPQSMGSIMTRLQELKRVKPAKARGEYTVINSHSH